MQRWRLSPQRYRLICAVALGLLCVIVVSGAGVRLTGAGLGCDDWPNCNNEKLIDVSSTHAAIEQVNRLFTGLVAVGVMLAVLGSLARSPRRRDLTWLSLGLVAGVVGQIILGGITVLVDLHPAAVQGHFLLSMVLVANAVWLLHRAGQPDGPISRRVSMPTVWHLRLVVVTTLLAIVAGTVVTGAGPHAGDERARRFGIDISSAAQIHSVAVWIAVATVVSLMWSLRSRPSDRKILDGVLVAWVCVALGQAAIGYLQYFTGVPAALVAVHIAGATLLWGVTVWMIAATSERRLGGSVAEGADELDDLFDDRREEAADVAEEVGEGLRAP
ncbi:MAG: COX15/CtaA family protein [Ilumatobacteraceae bacterium]